LIIAVGILLDTNALVWMDAGDTRLGTSALQTINAELRAATAFVCPISYWEVQLAINRKRLSLAVPIEQWRHDHLATGYIERAITGIDTILMAQLADLHGDPADRLIMAVAINAGLTLLTADEKILTWPGQLMRTDTRG
jgi:PIN domain nuclease of toxin-antitoxin system